MKPRYFIIPGLMAAALLGQGFALLGQGFGGYGRRGITTMPNQPATPQTPAQLAARQLRSVAVTPKLDAAQNAALTGNTDLVGALTTEETTLQSNDEMLKTDYEAFASQLIGSPGVPPAELTGIQTLLTNNFQTRATAAGEIVAALQSLSEPLSAEQTQNLPKLVETLVGAGSATAQR